MKNFLYTMKKKRERYEKNNHINKQEDQ